MLRQVSNGQYLDAIRMAEKFILHVEVLFATIDDLEYHFYRLNMKGLFFFSVSVSQSFMQLYRHVARPGGSYAVSKNCGIIHVAVAHARNRIPEDGHDAGTTCARDGVGTLPQNPHPYCTNRGVETGEGAECTGGHVFFS
jgi:hypothetical protein